MKKLINSADTVLEESLDGLAASWLDDGAKAALTASFRAELDGFERALAPASLRGSQ